MRVKALTAFTDPNGDTHRYRVYYPEALAFADSARCDVELHLVDSDGAGEFGAEVTITITDVATAGSYTERRFLDAKGDTTFDIARYVQIIMGDNYQDTVFDYSSNSELVQQRQISISMTAFATSFFTFTFDAVHGNNRIDDRWWKGTRKLKWFSAYPFCFDFANVDEVTVRKNGTSQQKNFPKKTTSLSNTRVRVKPTALGTGSMRISATAFYFDVATSESNTLSGTPVLKSGATAVELEENSCAADINAAYLRWTDRHGEMRHWLFSKNKETETVTTAIDRMSGIDPDRYTDGVARDGRIRDGENVREITVNTGLLSGWEYEVASSIYNASHVDMLEMAPYIESGTIRWRRLVVKAGTYTRSLRNRNDQDQNDTVAVTLQYDAERSAGV